MQTVFGFERVLKLAERTPRTFAILSPLTEEEETASNTSSPASSIRTVGDFFSGSLPPPPSSDSSASPYVSLDEDVQFSDSIATDYCAPDASVGHAPSPPLFLDDDSASVVDVEFCRAWRSFVTSIQGSQENWLSPLCFDNW
jgi:hypothetical protein